MFHELRFCSALISPPPTINRWISPVPSCSRSRISELHQLGYYGKSALRESLSFDRMSPKFCSSAPITASYPLLPRISRRGGGS